MFDAGKRAANVDTAKAHYESFVSQYRAAVRTAVKEVQDALVHLVSADQPLSMARTAAADYQAHFVATRQLYDVGLGSLIDSETARRNAVTAQLAVIELQQEQISARIARYRAVGGSWEERQTQQVASDPEGLPDQQTVGPTKQISQPPKQFSGNKS